MKDLMKQKYEERMILMLKVLCAIVWLGVVLIGAIFIEKLIYEEKDIQPQSFVEEKETNNYQESIGAYIDEETLNALKISKESWSYRISKEVDKASAKYKIPEFVIYAIIATESNLHRTEDISLFNIASVNQKAKSSYDCRGLMQISQYALNDYNRIHSTSYTMDDIYNVSINIDIGVWYFNQFRSVANSWTEMYIIYNVGYGCYSKINYHWFYGVDDNWYNEKRNSFFFMNGVMPPTDNRSGLYGHNKLPEYRPKERFDKCLHLCYDVFKY